MQGDLNASEDGMVWPITWEPIKQGDLFSTSVCAEEGDGTTALCEESCFILGPTFLALASSEDCRSSSGARQT